MKINSNVGLRDRSRITLSNFKGLDTLSAAVDVSAIHATDMKNLISRDGVNHKRFGWKTQFRIRDDSQYLKIQGIFSFTIFQKDFLMAYAGYTKNGNEKYRFYLINTIENSSTDITSIRLDKDGNIDKDENGNYINTSVSPVDVEKLIDNECKCYVNGNKVYFIGCGDFLVFSRWTINEEEYFELRRVVGNDDVYIPTTTENIGSEEDGQHYTRITAEERNILSPYTYNLLFGANEVNDGESLSYMLDCNDFTDIQVTINREDKDVTLKPVSNIYTVEKGDRVKKLKISFNDDIVKDCTVTAKEDEINYSYRNIYVVEKPELNATLIKMENGDELKLSFSNLTWREKQQIIRDNNGFALYEIRYFEPLASLALVLYVSGGDSRYYSYKEVKFNCSIILPDKTPSDSSFDLQIKTTITFYDKEDVVVDLSEYSAIVESMYYANYYNIGSVKLKNDEENDGVIYTGEINRVSGELKLNAAFDIINKDLILKEKAYAPLVPDVPNIKVKLTRPFDASIVTSGIRACEFGAQGGTDRLFIVDNTGNTVRWSKDEDFTYFGEKSWCVCGTSDKSITGMDRLNDSTLLIVKEYSPREPSIFIITGNILTGETEAGTVDYTALFTPHGYQVGMGAVGEITNFNGDCLMVAKDGLYAVSLGENMTVDSRYVLHRSRQISNKLEKFDLSKAKCVSFNGKFFVYVGGEEQECYVADNKYTASFEGDIQNVVNYEWWRWTNIPVNVWGFVENELWFGTEDGQLCSFTENFYDETFSRLYTGLATYEVDENEIVGFTLNKDIKVSIGDIFTPTCDFYGGITTDRFECINGETRFYLPLNDYLENETIYINNNAYVIKKQDLYFSIQYSTDSNEITFYRNYKNKPLTVMDEVVIVLKDRDNKFPKWSAVKSQGGLNPSNEEFTATLSHKEPVISKWVSGAMDLGTRAYSKSLTYLVLTGEKDLANRLKYGLKTRFTHRDYELLRANNDLDFNELDLKTVSIDSDFASSFTKKLNIRNINFLMLYFISDTAEDIALNSVQIEFKLYKRNIGVR